MSLKARPLIHHKIQYFKLNMMNDERVDDESAVNNAQVMKCPGTRYIRVYSGRLYYGSTVSLCF